MFTFLQSYTGAWAARAGRGTSVGAGAAHRNLTLYASFSTLNVLFYVLCRVLVLYYFLFELSFVGGGFCLIH